MRTGPDAAKVLDVDTIVMCAGQVSERSLADTLEGSGASVHIIGGAELATELATGQGGGAADDADMHRRSSALGETLGGIAARLRQ